MSARQSEFKPVEESFQVAQAAFEKVRTDFENSQRVAGEAKQQADTATTALAAAKDILAKVTNENTEIQKQVNAMAKGVPMLKESADKAGAAASQFPDDASLADAAKTLQGSAADKQAQLDEMRKTATQKAAALQQAQQNMATAQKNAAEATQQLAVANQQQQRLMPLVKPAEEKANATKQAYDKVSAELTSAQQLVSRWQDEITFSKRLSDLTAQRKSVMEKLGVQETKHAELEATANAASAELAEANAELTGTKSELESNKQKYQAAIGEVAKAKQAQVAAMQMTAQLTAKVTQLQQLLAKLNETAGKANEAAELAKDDQQVAAAVGGWKALIDAKSKSLVAATEDVKLKTKAQQDAVENVAAKEKLAAASLVAQQTSEKKVAELAARIPQLQQTMTAAMKTAEDAANALAAVQQQLDELRKTIAIAQGLEPAA